MGNILAPVSLCEFNLEAPTLSTLSTLSTHLVIVDIHGGELVPVVGGEAVTRIASTPSLPHPATEVVFTHT